MSDMSATQSIIILIAVSCAVLVICIVVSVHIVLARLKKVVIHSGNSQMQSTQSESQDARELSNLVSELQNAHPNNTAILPGIESLKQAIRALDTSIATKASAMAAGIKSLVSEDRVTKAKAYLEKKLEEQSKSINEHTTTLERNIGKKIDERSSASVKRDRSFLASSYPRLLAIISADLHDGELEDETKAEPESKDKDNKESRAICWKARLTVLPLCENKNCPTRSSRLKAVRALKNNNKFDYTIKDGHLYISSELLATGGMFVVRLGLAAIPHTAVLQHFLQITGISPELVSYVSSVLPGLFPPKVIEELSNEGAKSVVEDFGKDAGNLILQQVIETSRDKRRMPALQQEVETRLVRGRVAILNVGGTAHLELGRLMEREDKDGHVPFGGLVRILPDDGEYLWVCDKCQRTYSAKRQHADPTPAVAA